MTVYDYDLVFDKEECGSAASMYFGLLTDYGSPADILIRWPTRGYHQVDNAHEKAEDMAKELIKRWNSYEAIKNLTINPFSESIDVALDMGLHKGYQAALDVISNILLGKVNV